MAEDELIRKIQELVEPGPNYFSGLTDSRGEVIPGDHV
jgi:hypothetical protein